MHPVERHLFATDFKDLAGTHLQGTIALSDELINLGIMDFLAGLKAEPAPSAPAAPDQDPAEARPDPRKLLSLLQVNQLEVKAKDGRIVVAVDVKM